MVDALGCLAGEAPGLSVLGRPASEPGLAADGAVDDRRLVAGRADVGGVGRGLQRDPAGASADAARSFRVAVTARAEVLGVSALAPVANGQRADAPASVAAVGGRAGVGVAGDAEGCAISAAGVDAHQASALIARLLGGGSCAAGAALTLVEFAVPADRLDPAAAGTLGFEDRAGHDRAVYSSAVLMTARVGRPLPPGLPGVFTPPDAALRPRVEAVTT